MTLHSLHSRYIAAGLAGIAVFLAACTSPAQKKNDQVGVSIRSLNYSARELAEIGVERPGEPNSGGGGGGDALNPYSSGGLICCFSIPPEWHPGLKVVVKYQFYPEKEYRKALVSVPPYADGKPSQIWLIVHEDETAEAVVSLYGPSRPEWPGKVKGYPVPSREYRVKLWEEKLRRERAEVAIFEKALKEENLTFPERESMEEALVLTRKIIQQLVGNKP